MTDLTVHIRHEREVDNALAITPEVWSAFWAVVETMQEHGVVFPEEVGVLLARRYAARQRCKSGNCALAE